MTPETNYHMREAMNVFNLVKVANFVLGELTEIRFELRYPPCLHVAYQKLNFSVEAGGRDEERDEDVCEVVEEISHVAAGGEDDGGDGVVDGAGRDLFFVGGGFD